jgi:hypothetical protein
MKNVMNYVIHTRRNPSYFPNIKSKFETYKLNSPWKPLYKSNCRNSFILFSIKCCLHSVLFHSLKPDTKSKLYQTYEDVMLLFSSFISKTEVSNILLRQMKPYIIYCG